MLKIAFLVLLTLIHSGCSSTPKPAAQIKQASPPPSDGILLKARAGIGQGSIDALKESFSEPHPVLIHIATNREHGGVTPGELSFGTAEVLVPHRHSVGILDAGFQSSGLKPQSLEDWKADLLKNHDWGMLVFVHGFNVDFKEAILRAAQIAYDLKFQGNVVLFSWPAGSEGGFLSKNLINKVYERNQRNAQASIEAARRFFAELASLPVPVQVIAHSMGHQVVIPALGMLSSSIDHPFIQELILNAPDIETAAFDREAPKLSKIANRITLYCSQEDNALLASKALNGNKRLGSCGLTRGVDVINVSEVDDPGLTGLGHSYYCSRPLLTDIVQVILGIPAERRLFIRSAIPSGTENFILRK